MQLIRKCLQEFVSIKEALAAIPEVSAFFTFFLNCLLCGSDYETC